MIAGSGKIILIESKNMYRGRAVVRKNWQKRKEKNIVKNITDETARHTLTTNSDTK